MDVQKIEKMLKRYTYEQPRILKGESAGYFDLEQKSLEITNFYEPSLQKTDTCRGLRTTLFFELKKEFPQNYVYRVIGTEPRFFFKSEQVVNATHSFILMSKAPLIDSGTILYGEEDQERFELIKHMNPLVIDPSYKIIESYKGSEYDINGISAPEIEEKLNLTTNLQISYKDKLPPLHKRQEHKYDKKNDDDIIVNLRPLALYDKHLISLGMKFSEYEKPELKIAIQQERQHYQLYDPSQIIDVRFIDKKIKNYAQAIKNTPLFEINKKYSHFLKVVK